MSGHAKAKKTRSRTHERTYGWNDLNLVSDFVVPTCWRIVLCLCAHGIMGRHWIFDVTPGAVRVEETGSVVTEATLLRPLLTCLMLLCRGGFGPVS